MEIIEINSAKLSETSKDLLYSTRIFRQTLSSVLPKDLVDYIMQIVTKQLASEKCELLSQSA